MLLEHGLIAPTPVMQDTMTICYHCVISLISHTCNKYNPIKPIGYPPSSIPLLPPPPIKNSARLVYDNSYGAGYVQGKQNAIVDQHLYTSPIDTCPYPDPPYVSYCKGYHAAYDFNWRIFLNPIKPLKAFVIDQREETIQYRHSP
jgi:hypothetical protein